MLKEVGPPKSPDSGNHLSDDESGFSRWLPDSVFLSSLDSAGTLRMSLGRGQVSSLDPPEL